MTYYPIYLNLHNRPCVVVGGGTIAEGKIKGLLEAGARVTVVAPQVTAGVAGLAKRGELDWQERNYRPGDLAQAYLAISATDDRQINTQVWQEAQARSIPVNVVDVPPLCDFIAPAIVRHGDLTLAISTNGKAPALAAHLRRVLEKSLGHEYSRFLEHAEALRAEVAQRGLPYTQRQRLWQHLLEETPLLDLMRQGEEDAALALARQVLLTP
ncbi:MAG: precorrin-2 dehydrogenase/sirohydrochlorin ferrochelatase family protein [Chloroflexota bacterium]